MDPTSPVASKYLESNKLNNDLQEGNSDEDDDNEDSDDDGGACCRGVKRMQVALYHAYERHKRTLWNLVYAVLFVLYVAYVVYSVMFRFGDEGSWRLVICSSIAALYLGYCLIESFFGILLLEKTRKTPENTALVSIGLRIFYTDVYQSVTRQVNIFFVYI